MSGEVVPVDDGEERGGFGRMGEEMKRKMTMMMIRAGCFGFVVQTVSLIVLPSRRSIASSSGCFESSVHPTLT